MKTYVFENPETGEVVRVRASSADEAEAKLRNPDPVPSAVRADVDYSLSDYVKGGLKGAALGGATGFIFGGPAGAIAGSVGGAAGELASMGLEDVGVGGAGQFGGGLAADIGTSLLMRRPSAGLVSRIPGAMQFTDDAVSALAQRGRAGRFLSRQWASELGGLPARMAAGRIRGLEPVDPNAAANVVRGAQNRYGELEDAYEIAKKIAEQNTTGVLGSSRPVVDAAEQLAARLEDAPHGLPRVVKNALELPDEITLQRAENLRQGVNLAYQVGTNPIDTSSRYFKKVEALRAPLDKVLDDIAARGGDVAVGASRDMRAAGEAMHRAVPLDSIVSRDIIDRGGIDNAQLAIDRIIGADRAVEEARVLLGLLKPVERVQLRRAAMAHVLQRLKGAGAASIEGSPRTGGAALGLSSKEAAALTEIMGNRAFARLQGLLRDVARSGRGFTPFSARMPAGRPRGEVFKTALIALAGGGGAGMLGGQEMGIAVAGLGASKAIFDSFQSRYGREAVANLALSALADPDVLRIVRAAGASSSTERGITRLAQTLVRRGLFAPEELPEAPTQSAVPRTAAGGSR